MTKEEILAKAKEIVSNDRNESHGDAFKNHAEIAEFWNIFLDKKLQPMASINAQDVAIIRPKTFHYQILKIFKYLI